VLAGVQYPSDVAAGQQLGRAVASLAIDRAQQNGSDAQWTGSVPSEPGHWSGTDPILPQADTWKTWALASGSEFRPGPPPAYNSPEEAADVAVLKDFQRTPKTNADASFWEYAAGGPRNYWFWAEQANKKIFEYRLGADPPRASIRAGKHRRLRLGRGLLGREIHVLGYSAVPTGSHFDNGLPHAEPPELSGGTWMLFDCGGGADKQFCASWPTRAGGRGRWPNERGSLIGDPGMYPQPGSAPGRRCSSFHLVAASLTEGQSVVWGTRRSGEAFCQKLTDRRGATDVEAPPAVGRLRCRFHPVLEVQDPTSVDQAAAALASKRKRVRLAPGLQPARRVQAPPPAKPAMLRIRSPRRLVDQ